jgi:glycerophosphoryl diester phosphodiesterase
VAAVFHDATLARATGGSDTRAVARVSYADLPRLEAEGGGGEPVPRLRDALAAMHGRVVNVELKSDVLATTLHRDVRQRLRLARAAIAAIADAPGADVVFSSFDPLLVLALAALAPRIPRAILVDRSTPRLATALPLALRGVVVAAHLEERLATPARVARLRGAGLRVAAWTVNDPARAVELAASGVTWLITDQPAVLIAALAAS